MCSLHNTQITPLSSVSLVTTARNSHKYIFSQNSSKWDLLFPASLINYDGRVVIYLFTNIFYLFFVTVMFLIYLRQYKEYNFIFWDIEDLSSWVTYGETRAWNSKGLWFQVRTLKTIVWFFVLQSANHKAVHDYYFSLWIVYLFIVVVTSWFWNINVSNYIYNTLWIR